MQRPILDLARSEFVRFVVTGTAAAGLLGILSFAAIRAGLPPFEGTLAAQAATIVASYLAQRSWTFGGRHHHHRAFPRYIAAQIACACLTASVAQAMARWGLSAAAVSLCVAVCSGAISFCLSRYWVFPARTA